MRPSKTSTLGTVLLAATVALGVVAAPRPAHAQPAGADAKPSADAVKKATEAFKEGTKLFGEKKFALALEQFRLSYDTVASPNSKLYVARCQAEMGNLREAYRTFESVIDEANERGKTEPKYLPTGEGARHDLDELSKKLVVITVTVANAPDAARVKVGGAPIAKEEWGKPIPLDPGPVDVVLEVPGAAPVRDHADLKAGQTKAFNLVGPDTGSAVPPPIETPKKEESSGGSPGLLIGGLVAAGIGVGGFVMFGVEGSMAKSTESDLQALCPSGCSPSDASAQDLVDQGKSQQLIANVGLAIGAVGLAAGATLIVIHIATADGGDAPKSDEALNLEVGPSYVGVRGRF
ncbi:MAG TPA: tetratricopeptide repeat protein [Polyangiaceae bacterium]|nr:tetratricopeptide repeat protein [Polyangiaceae bacterium]